MILNSVGLMILYNSNFKSANKSFTYCLVNLTEHKKDKVTFLFVKRISFIYKSAIDEH